MVKKRNYEEVWLMKIINTIVIALLLVACAPLPQHYGLLHIMNCTESIFIVNSKIECPNGEFSATSEVVPGDLLTIAQTAVYPESDPITIDKFLTNYNDARVSIVSVIDGLQVEKTWKYNDRAIHGKHLFHLRDCYFESATDFNKNFTSKNFIFMVHDEDLLK